MKRIIIILTCLTTMATAQDFEPGQIRFFWRTIPDSVFLSSAMPYFTQTNMLTGFQWASTLEMNNIQFKDYCVSSLNPTLSIPATSGTTKAI